VEGSPRPQITSLERASRSILDTLICVPMVPSHFSITPGKPKRGLSRREALKLASVAAAEAALLVGGGLTYGYKIEPGWIEVASVNLRLQRLTPEFNGYRIVQISDIHMSEWMNHERLAGIVERVNRIYPDLIVITGDLLWIQPDRYVGDLISTLGKLSSRDGVVGILGNHDHWSDPQAVREVYRESDIVELSNAVFTLKREDQLLHIAGIDDYWERLNKLDVVLENLPEQGCAILLAHEPDFADLSAPTGRFDLQLSGHSHGGQVVLPIIGPPLLPQYGRKYPSGLYKIQGMYQYTNRGVGMISPQVRVNCRPEITVFTIYTS
jgi:predicted MPP superfamily phosphohydrolase